MDSIKDFYSFRIGSNPIESTQIMTKKDYLESLEEDEIRISK